MVTTGSSSSTVPPDPNRIIAVVTGANSGIGLGICHQLLSNLSLPLGAPLPASTPQALALGPSQRHLLDEVDEPDKEIPPDHPQTLTIILACRSGSKAEISRKAIIKRHEKELARRERKGIPVREGWREGLELIWEGVDFDSVGGSNGILTLCERLKEKYPHITSLFLNAGLGAYAGNDYLHVAGQCLADGPSWAFSHPKFMLEVKGVMSEDGERGMIWGVNVLAPYIMAKELAPLLQSSPSTLPFPPRIVYTSSGTANHDSLKPDPLNDYQLLTYAYQEPDGLGNYAASKYMGDLIMVQLDRELVHKNTRPHDRPPIRCLTAEPGIVCTNIFEKGLGPWRWLRTVLWLNYWMCLYFCRLLGSRYHPIYTTNGALPLIYAALVNERYLMPADKVPAQKFEVISTRWGKTYVGYGEVDRWEESEGIGEGLAKACEAIRLEWRRREGLQ